MNKFQIGLDKYLTTPPDDGYDSWFEDVCDKLSQHFYDTNEKAIMDDKSEMSGVLQNCFRLGHSPELSAMLVERQFPLGNRNNDWLFNDIFISIRDRYATTTKKLSEKLNIPERRFRDTIKHEGLIRKAKEYAAEKYNAIIVSTSTGFVVTFSAKEAVKLTRSKWARIKHEFNSMAKDKELIKKVQQTIHPERQLNLFGDDK